MAWLKLSVVILAIAGLSSCAAAKLSLEKKDLDVQTRTMTAIFVPPPSAAHKTVFLDIRSSVLEFDRKPFINYVQKAFNENGSLYTVTENPEHASYILAVSILNLEKDDPTAAELAALGYGGPKIGETLFSVTEFIDVDDSDDLKDVFKIIAAALIIGAVEHTVNSSVKDVEYALVAEVEVSAPLESDVFVDTNISLPVSDNGTAETFAEEISDRIKYRTKIVTMANKANLTLEEASNKIFAQMAYAIAGIFVDATPVEALDMAGAGDD